jgi:hypothetical protein
MTPRRRDFCPSQRFHAIRQIVAESSRSGVAFARRLASTITLVGLFVLVSFTGFCHAQEPQAVAKAEPIETLRFGRVDGRGPDWKRLGEADFVVVNGVADTWKFVDGEIHSTGKPVGVMRTKEKYTNFEYVVQWRHLEKGGNSGIFAWVSDEGLAGIQPGQLPKSGIEVQMLDHGYHEKYTRSSGKVGDWFTSNGDIFAVGRSKMKPFPPLSPNGSRSFPKENRSLGSPEWNHYYVRGINGEIRLWVNGIEVSGGSGCDPATGYLCVEAEGSPVEFREFRIRVLP